MNSSVTHSLYSEEIKNLGIFRAQPHGEGVPEVMLTEEASEELSSDRSVDSIEKEEEKFESLPLPKVVNDQVNKWIEYFTNKDKERFQRFLNRGYKYKDVVQTILEESGLPSDLYYLAMIESGYTAHAHSRASAVGVWQFIRGTARRYGLEVSYYIDERRDPIRSTESAARYLTDLYNVYQSWELAMASYNCGELCVLRAIMKGKTRNYWELVQKRLLPRETRNYVPKFIAASLIGQDPEKYGLIDPSTQADIELFPSVEAIEVPSPVHLKDIAKASGLEYTKLKDLNPHLRRRLTPPNQKLYEVWVPRSSVSSVQKAEPTLAKLRKKHYKRYYAKSRGGRYHVIRRGETLSSIARRYGISISYLKRINGLRHSRIYAGKRIRVSARSYKVAAHRSYHRVRRGDNLSKIARRYGLSIRQLKRMNGIRGSRIYVGQKLKLKGNYKKPSRYRVRRGDNLIRVAQKFSVSVSRLKRLNRLRRNTIYAGEWLKIK